MLNLGLEKNPLQLSIEKDDIVLRNTIRLSTSMEVKEFNDDTNYEHYKSLMDRIKINYRFFHGLLKKHGDLKFKVPEELLNKLPEGKFRDDTKYAVKNFTLKYFTQWIAKELYLEGRGLTPEQVKGKHVSKKMQELRFILAVMAYFKRAISQGKVKLNKPLTYPDGTQVYAPERNNKPKTSGSGYQRHQVDVPYKPKATIGY